jgi:hypothetical protein
MQNENKPEGSLKDVITVHRVKTEDALNATDTIRSIQRWFEKTRSEKTARDFLAQVACHYEEVAECTEALGHPAGAIHKLSENFRVTDPLYVDTDSRCKPLPEGWRKDLLDALCDQIVTAIGVAHCANLDIVGALQEVNESNWSKFENDEPIRDEHGKIIKGEHYKAPELGTFVLEAPKWVMTKPKVGVKYMLRVDADSVVEVLSISAFRSSELRSVVTYRLLGTDKVYSEFADDFHRYFEPCN